MTLNSEPTGADRSGERDDVLVKRFVTPGSVTVSKSSDALPITRRKPGYAPVIGIDPSSLDGVILGNVLFGGLTCMGIDLLTHADQAYHQPDLHQNVIVRMHPERPAPHATPAGPSTALSPLPAPSPTDPGT